MKGLAAILSLMLVSSAWAQDTSSSESFPFEDFPDFDAAAPDAPARPTAQKKPEEEEEEVSAEELAGALPTEEPASSPAPVATPAPRAIPPAERPSATTAETKAPPAPNPAPVASQDPFEDTFAEEDLSFEDEVETKTAAGPSPEPEKLTVTAPAAPTPLLSQPTNFDDFTEGQESLMSSGAEYPEDIQALENRLKDAESIYSDQRLRQEGLGDPGESLAPSEKFARVPLRPPMSDANWMRWAGPMAQKDYKIRRGDSLWSVSERLFGNPYLWPKIWHLNARITNPHIIERGMTLSFNPGNPGSAPELAFRSDSIDPRDASMYPLTKLDKKKTLLEMIDETLRSQISTSHPPFQHFLLDRKPEVIAKLPPALNRDGRVFFLEGDRFRLNMGDGIFPVVKVKKVSEKFVTGYRVRWLGLVQVRDKQAEVIKAFAEMEAGDEIVQRRFQLSPLAVHRDTIGPEYRDDTSLVPLEDGATVHGGDGQMMGVIFPAIGLGPRPGALLDVQVGPNKKVQALLVDRDQRFGTLWIVGGDKEVVISDKFY